MYTIYKVVSPSGKCYVGMTKLKLSDRWDAHCTRLRRKGYTHPFGSAFRKYGKNAFVLETLQTSEDVNEAKSLEMRWINFYRSTERAYGYNLSPGGDYDALSGAKAMKEKMKDPVFYAAYTSSLRAAMGKRDPKLFDNLADAARKWKKENPVRTYKMGRRAIRIATAAQNRPWTGVPDVNVQGSWGRLWIPGSKVETARRRYFTRKNALAQWGRMSEGQRKRVGESISKGQKKSFKNSVSRRAKVAEQLTRARANVDREKQARAASRGQKEWWVKLRKDPERYRTYMEKRNATLRDTIKKSKNLRHTERGA